MSGVRESRAKAEEIERWALATCQSLGLPITDATDDFFAAGGTSLTVIRLIARAEEEYGEECLPPDDVYERSTIRDIAASIAARTGT